ncbi:saccharopine dehydrogenase family protein [Haloferax mediterranei]|uniref:saccharopine dehydrogenase family protein n=1 Tax=Haloferax mediterranei TaxID=2252 RepID=UPI000B1A7E5D|nr:saccharopine dehydrogenase NADP-binding domain-containing protein [Haloferax mediterranei]
MEGELLVYGSYGYTGSLIAHRAVADDASPTIAGRRAEPLEQQATELGVDHRVFSLEQPAIVEDQLADVDAVLNCAGPFVTTADPLVDACLETGTDYLDIAGRVQILEAAAKRDADAEQAGITVLPAVGFDAVPTDCLAAILAEEVPNPDRLTMAIDGLGTFSPGTVKSIIKSLDRSGAVREDGAVRSVPVAWKTRTFDFGVEEKTGVTVPWGTVSTAYYSTGIENIETYATVPDIAVKVMRRIRPLSPLLSSSLLQRLLVSAVDRVVSGPTPDQRPRTRTESGQKSRTTMGAGLWHGLRRPIRTS